MTAQPAQNAGLSFVAKVIATDTTDGCKFFVAQITAYSKDNGESVYETFMDADTMRKVRLMKKSLEEQVKRYRSRKQYKLLQPSAVQTLLNVQHACSAGCRIQKKRNAFRREREWISGDKWTQGTLMNGW